MTVRGGIDRDITPLTRRISGAHLLTLSLAVLRFSIQALATGARSILSLSWMRLYVSNCSAREGQFFVIHLSHSSHRVGPGGHELQQDRMQRSTLRCQRAFASHFRCSFQAGLHDCCQRTAKVQVAGRQRAAKQVSPAGSEDDFCNASVSYRDNEPVVLTGLTGEEWTALSRHRLSRAARLRKILCRRTGNRDFRAACHRDALMEAWVRAWAHAPPAPLGSWNPH